MLQILPQGVVHWMPSLFSHLEKFDSSILTVQKGDFLSIFPQNIHFDRAAHIVRSIWMNQRKPPINKGVSAVFRGPKKVHSK